MNTCLISVLATLATTSAFAAGHEKAPSVEATDQSVAHGTVTAERIIAAENGWLVVHRTDAEMKPGSVVGHAPLKLGENSDVAAILTEDVQPGEMLMLMVHSEEGGMQMGIFEYTLGATEDGPIRVNNDLVMTVITVE